MDCAEEPFTGDVIRCFIGEFHRRIVTRILQENCYENFIGELFTRIYRRISQKYFYENII